MGRNPDGLGRKPHRWRNRWRAYLTVGYQEDGKPIRKYVYGRTQKECVEKLEEARRRLDAGFEDVRDIRLRDYLEEWLAQKALEVKPRTISVYRRDLRFVMEYLGHMRLTEIKPLHVQRMMSALMEKEYQQGNTKRSYTARAANQARGLLANALNDAVRMRMLETNPAKPVRPFRHEPVEMNIWTAVEVERFLGVTEAFKATYHALFYTALTTGMRVGELIALEWRDITNGKIHVRRTLTEEDEKPAVDTPKSRASSRVLDLPTDTVEALERQREALAIEGIDTPLVFPTASGGMATHSGLRRSLHCWAGKAGVRKIRMHDLRHYPACRVIPSGGRARCAMAMGRVFAWGVGAG